ncbi:MAG: 50S ribosomal protein L17 [uncultured bacterium]|nr:MAG: 50S ribosomal protein L17 [uncultured bacterium]
MNKKVFGRKLSRSRPAREALFTSLAKALIINGKIVTTRAKAKAVTPDVEKMVTLARKSGITSRRKVMSMLDNSREEVNILFADIAKAFSERTSGFTRIISLPKRRGDNAQMVRLEWTEKIGNANQKLETGKKASKKEVKTEKKVNKPVSKKTKKAVTNF